MPKSAVIFNSIDLHEIFPRLGQLVFLSVGVALLEHPAARLHVRGLRWGARLHRAPRLGADPERARLPCLTMCAFLVCFAVSFRIFHTYSGVMRYSSFSDLLCVSSAVVWLFQTSDWIVAFGYVDIILMGLFVVALM